MVNPPRTPVPIESVVTTLINEVAALEDDVAPSPDRSVCNAAMT